MFHIMIVVNVLYVLAEFIFNIVLLKVVSAEVSLNDIQEVETLGRGLAAFGFTFIILKLFQGIRLDIKKNFFIMSFFTVVTYPLFYIGQEKFIDGWAENSSPETRSKMGNIHLLKTGLLNGALELESVPYNKEIKDMPESKAFITNIALFMMNNDKVLSYIEDNKEEVAAAVFESDVIERVEHYNQIHYEVFRNIGNEFSSYNHSLEKLARKESQVSRSVDANYRDLVNYLGSRYKRDRGRTELRGMSFAQYSRTPVIQEFIKNNIKKQGGVEPSGIIDISSSLAMTRSILSEDSKVFNDRISAVEKKYDMIFPRGIKNETDFVNHPEVKKILKVELGPLYVPIKYPDYWSSEEMSKILIDNSGVIGANMAKNFVKKGDDPEESKAIVKAMIIPPVALFLSLFFAFTNLAILIKTTIGIFTQNKYFSGYVVYFPLFLSLLLLPTLLANKYTESDSYSRVISPVKEHSIIIAVAVTWVMKFEPFVYRYGSPYVNEKNIL